MDNRTRATTIALLLLVASSFAFATALRAEDACTELDCDPDLTLLDEGFDGYPAGADPQDWYDTARQNSLLPADDYRIYHLGGDPALGTSSWAYNIHTHYVTAGSADWYVAGLEIDGENGRFRLAGFHRVGYGIQDVLQGPRLLALTDWVDWADAGQGSPASKIWLTIGDRHADRYDADYHVKWVRFEAGATLQGWTNARATGDDGYRLRLQQTQGTQFLPAQRGGDVLPIGDPGSWDSDSHRKKHVLRDHDGTHYLFYEGMNALRESEIGLASAPGPEGPWTPAAQNPVVPRTVLPDDGANYDVLTAPWVIKDDAEPDPNKRWRLMACGEVRNSSIHRMFLLNAPAADGPWSLEPGAGPDGAVLAGSASGDWKGTGVCDPVIWWDAAESRWAMLYSGIRQDYGWSVGYAVSPDLLQWSEEPSNPLITANAGGVQQWTSVNGKRLTVADASSFREDGIVIVRNGSTEEDWGLSRVRRIAGSELELYHEVAGVSGTASTRAVAMLGAGSITPHALVRNDDGMYRLFVTAFQPFILGAGSFGNRELVGSLEAPTPVGPWQWDDLGSPQVPPNRWSADRAQVNVGLVNHPVNSAP